MTKTLFQLVCEPFYADEIEYAGVFIANKFNEIETLTCTEFFDTNTLIKRQSDGKEYIIKKSSKYLNYYEYLITEKGDRRMTNEEALKHIKPRLKLYIQCTDDNIALHKAVKALEKQIPKKVIWKFGGDGLPYAYCSACGNSVIRGNYCDKCGQALDWSEENANNS